MRPSPRGVCEETPRIHRTQVQSSSLSSSLYGLEVIDRSSPEGGPVLYRDAFEELQRRVGHSVDGAAAARDNSPVQIAFEDCRRRTEGLIEQPTLTPGQNCTVVGRGWRRIPGSRGCRGPDKKYSSSSSVLERQSPSARYAAHRPILLTVLNISPVHNVGGLQKPFLSS